MKLLVSAHRLELGGTQVNAVELAATLRDRHGFDVVVWATPGPALNLVRELGLRFEPAPDVSVHPSPARMRALRGLVTRLQPDLVHAWDWWQALDAFFGVHLPMGVPLVVSDMMMELTAILPKTVPTTFGTPMVLDAARRGGWCRAGLMLPPVDMVHNAPDAVSGQQFRERLSMDAGGLLVVTVSRLAGFKADSLRRSIDAIRHVGADVPVTLVIVGSGAERAALEARADQVNAELGRKAVIVFGPLVDPRPAYAAADIVIGMGGSAMRGMAFQKPVIVVGEAGFAEVFAPETAEGFYWRGMYGWGGGKPVNLALEQTIRRLAEDRDLRERLGRYGRTYIAEHHSLEVVADRFAVFCRAACVAGRPTGTRSSDLARLMYVYLRERRFLCPSRSPAKHDDPIGPMSVNPLQTAQSGVDLLKPGQEAR